MLIVTDDANFLTFPIRSFHLSCNAFDRLQRVDYSNITNGETRADERGKQRPT